MDYYNYGLERKKFNAKWDKLGPEYAAAGMSEADIQVMYDVDWQEFKSERIYRIHTQPLECEFSESETAAEDNSPLVHRQLERLSVKQPDIRTWGRFDWVEDIDTPELTKRIKSLSQMDLEVLSYLVMDAACALNRAEIARLLGVSRAAITKRLGRIKSLLEKFRPQG